MTCLPAGINDRNIEAFSLDGKIKVIINGRIIDILDSIEALSLFRDNLEADPKALKMIEDLGIKNPVIQILTFIHCRYGDFDRRADITQDGVSIPEYWDCGRRGDCECEGTVCLLPGGLTTREIDIVKLVAKDLPDKQIADRLKISVNTVHTHLRNIEHKINAASKCGIVRFAYQNNIL